MSYSRSQPAASPDEAWCRVVDRKDALPGSACVVVCTSLGTRIHDAEGVAGCALCGWYIGARHASATEVYTAEFAYARDAKAFAERIEGEGFSAERVVRNSRVVTWEGPSGREYFTDMLETVGYYGSAPHGRKATLDGYRAPATY